MTLRKSTGDMYPQVGYTINPVAGFCPHNCIYCYVKYPPVSWTDKYKGEIRLHEKELQESLQGLEVVRTVNPPGVLPHLPLVFVCSCFDLFAEQVPRELIRSVLEYLKTFPDNTYLLQTKNPWRLLQFEDWQFPPHLLFGITMETNYERQYTDISDAPSPLVRDFDMEQVFDKFPCVPVLVSIEPILHHDPDKFLDFEVFSHKLSMVSIGYNSSNRKEAQPPSWWQPEPGLTARFIKGLAAKEHVFSIFLKKNIQSFLSETTLTVNWMERGAVYKGNPVITRL